MCSQRTQYVIGPRNFVNVSEHFRCNNRIVNATNQSKELAKSEVVLIILYTRNSNNTIDSLQLKTKLQLKSNRARILRLTGRQCDHNLSAGDWIFRTDRQLVTQKAKSKVKRSLFVYSTAYLEITEPSNALVTR